MDIFNALRNASSQDASRAAESLENLQAAQKRSGAFTEMLSIAATNTIALDIRRLAIIQFKNVGVNNWRNRTLFTDEHRAATRQYCISFLSEPDDIIAQCSAVIIAKIYRIDTNKTWPELLPGLLNLININAEARFASSSPIASLTLGRALHVLNQILKEISAIKIPSGMQFMGTITADVYTPLMAMYGRFSSAISDSFVPATINDFQTAIDAEVLHVLYKCLAKIMLWVWNKIKQRAPDEDRALGNFFSASATQFQAMFELRLNLVVQLRSHSDLAPSAVGTRAITYLTSHVRAFGKWFRKMQQSSISRFVLLPGCSALIMYYWGKVVEANRTPELIGDHIQALYPSRVLLQGMVLFKDALSQWTPTRKANNPDAVNEVLPEAFIDDAVRLLVTRFLPLKESDLTMWQGDPEEWINEEDKDNEAWEYDLRPCAERVLMTMCHRYEQYVAPLIQAMFEEITAVPPADDLGSILRKEAVYCAVGRCFAHRSGVDIDLWLRTSLTIEAFQTNPKYRILKRRIAWVLGELAEQGEPSLGRQAEVWKLLSHLLQDQSSSSDIAVRLSAVVAIQSCIDTLRFNPDVFHPFLAGVINSLMQLMADVETLESKRRIASCLYHVIERNGDKIAPFMAIITNPIPQLWASSGDDFLFKAALLDLTKELVQASRESSSDLQYIVVPLIQESMRPEAALRLDEDGISLWLAALRNARSILPSVSGASALIDLLPGAIELLRDNLDLLGSILGIVESYVLLDPVNILRTQGLELFNALGQCMRQAVLTNTKDVLIALNMVMQLAPSNMWADAMHHSGLFKWLLNLVVSDKGNVEVLKNIFYVFSRMILQDTAVFLHLLQANPSPEGVQLLDKLLDVWWRRFDSMAEPRHRKLTAMAMGRLVASGRPEILKRMSGETFNLWLDVLGEMKEAMASSDGHQLHLYWKDRGSDIPESLLKGAAGTLEEDRRVQLYTQDPVQTTLLTSFLATQMKEAPANTPGGPAAFDSYLTQTDPLVLDQLKKALLP